MVINKNESSKTSFEPVSEGMKSAVCVGIIDLGVHENETFNTEQDLVRFIWEVDESYEKDGKILNRMVSRDYTKSLNEKSNLYKMLVSWRGRDFVDDENVDLSTLLGQPCLINISHRGKDGKVFADVGTVTPLMKGQQPLGRTHDLTAFDIKYDTAEEKKATLDAFNELPEYIRNKIMKSVTWRAMEKKRQSELTPVDDGELPF